MIVELPWDKPPLTGNRTRGNPHARAAEVKRAKDQAREAIRAAGLVSIVGADVILHYRPRTKLRRDADGLFPTLKVVQDALVLEQILPDDSWIHVPSATCRIHPPNGELATTWLELTNITHYQENQ